MRKEAIVIGILSCMLVAIGFGTPVQQLQQENTFHKIVALSQTAEPITIVGNPQLAQQSRGGVGTRSDPYILAGLTIVSSGICISIQNTTAFFLIKDCELECTTHQTATISFTRVENGFIERCYLRGGSFGLLCYECVECTIKESSFIDCYDGVFIGESGNCTVLDCNIHSNNIGVQVVGSNRSLIVNSSIYKNSFGGVIITEYSVGTTVYQNGIGWNGEEVSTIGSGNAYDAGNDTQFTNGIDSGNAWSDYDDSGSHGIPGPSGSFDTFATLLTDTESPIIVEPLDKVFDVESNGETITWIASEELPHTYRLFINSIPQDIVLWDGREITISLDALPEGTHILEMNIADAAGNVATDEVTVTGVSFMLGGIGTELVLAGSILTVVLFILVITIIKKLP